MAINSDVCEKDCLDKISMLSPEKINDFDIFELSEMIMSLEYAIHYTKECIFALSFVGIEETSDKIKAIMNELKNYLEIIKCARRTKISEQDKIKNFMKDVNA